MLALALGLAVGLARLHPSLPVLSSGLAPRPRSNRGRSAGGFSAKSLGVSSTRLEPARSRGGRGGQGHRASCGVLCHARHLYPAVPQCLVPCCVCSAMLCHAPGCAVPHSRLCCACAVPDTSQPRGKSVPPEPPFGVTRVPASLCAPDQVPEPGSAGGSKALGAEGLRTQQPHCQNEGLAVPRRRDTGGHGRVAAV